MTVFVAGVHGVGKSFLCQRYVNDCSVVYESASGLIRKERAQVHWSTDKKVAHIDDNQIALRTAVQRIITTGQSLLLDGHFVLINDKSEFVALEPSVFQDIGITGVVLLEADAGVIASRLAARDSSRSAVDIGLFLERERAQAHYVCQELSVPLHILDQPDFPEFSKVVSSFLKLRSGVC
jgi:adenylate kinase